jgi:hypothetical protein
MNQKIKNSETPYFSTSPVQDQFGQIIVAFGITKKEKLAADLFLKFIHDEMNTHEILELIEDCFGISATFFNYENENQIENDSKIIM